ncbi:MAG: hypothetical protein IPP71_11425 [Bacteroidetes bacterium]|nr:hypothetical protein [Bacteroidota bacterium]
MIAGNYDIKSSYAKLNAKLSDIKLNEILGNKDMHNLSAKISWNGKAKGINTISGQGSIEFDELAFKDIKTYDLNLDFKIDRQVLLFKLTGIDSTLSCDIAGDFGWEQKANHGQLAGNFSFYEGRSDLLPGNCSIKSELSASFSNRLGDLEAAINMHAISLVKDDHIANLDTLSLMLSRKDTIISSLLSSDFVIAEFNSPTSITEFTSALSKIEFEKILTLDATNYFNGSYIATLPAFNLNVAAQYDSIFTLFLPDSVFRFHHADLTIRKSNKEQSIHAELEIDSLNYLNAGCYGAKLALMVDQKTMHGDLTIDSLEINDEGTGLTKLQLDVLPEKITGSIFIADSSGAPLYQLGAEALKGKGSINFRTAGSDWIVNSNKWTISPAEFLKWEIGTNDFIADLNLQHEAMKINLNGRKSDSLKMNLQNINISKLASVKVLSNLPEGIVNADFIYSAKENKNLEFKFDVNQLKWKEVVADHVGANGF